MAKNSSITVKVEAWQKNSITSYCIKHGHMELELPKDLRLKGNSIADLLRPVVDYIAQYNAELNGITDPDQAKEVAMHPYENSLLREYEDEIGRLTNVAATANRQLNVEKKHSASVAARCASLEKEVADLRLELGLD